MRVACVQWPEGLIPCTPQWSSLADDVRRAAPDLLVTNEMPFGVWLAAFPTYDPTRAHKSVVIHDEGLVALKALHLPLVVSSRPVHAGDRLSNEAFVLDHGCSRHLHHKHYFPAEPGWHESDWFVTARPGFDFMETPLVRLGALLCTELMFNEHARAYGRAGVHLIAAPRATGQSVDAWKTACGMAAGVSGAYIVSSNRTGSSPGTPTFGGCAFAFAPDGTLVAQSQGHATITVFDLDPAIADRQKSEYPLYVTESLRFPD
jgi:N-carbamoylputrescine amidase